MPTHMLINTEIDVAHLELIKIFLKANNLIGIEINEFPLEIRGRFHMVLQLESKFGGSSEDITFLGLRHAGILNMFDDYLLKCGVSADVIKPKSIHRQIQDEKEERINEDFLKHLQEIKKHKNENPYRNEPGL